MEINLLITTNLLGSKKKYWNTSAAAVVTWTESQYKQAHKY